MHALAQADAGAFWQVGAVLIAVMVATFVATFIFWRRARMMTDTATSRVRSAAQGYVELEGTSAWLDGPPIICPLTAHRCAWWSYSVERRERRGRRSRWETVDKRTSDDLFLLDDGTGGCVIDPVGATVAPTRKRVWYGRSRSPDRGPEAGGGALGALFGGPYRYTERLIELDGPVYALGEFRTRRHGEANTAAEVRALLAEWKADQAGLHDRFDVDGDGRIDAREWEAARRVARMRVRRDQNERAAQPGLHVLARPNNGQPYLLAGVSQTALIRRFRVLAGACLAGFVAATAVLAWLLQARGLV